MVLVPAAEPSAYGAAGVHPRAAAAALEQVTARLRPTWPWPERRRGSGRVALKFGAYANVIDIGGGRGVAVCNDGIGSKALIAEALGNYRTIGIDCVAMNVNDLVCVGAMPLTLVDYIAIERIDAHVLTAVAEGLAEGAERAGISVSGGEIAELPDTIRGADGAEPRIGLDLVGTAVGTVPLDRLLPRELQPGDAVIGIASSGIHANGLTLARKVFLNDGGMTVHDPVAEFGHSLGEELLEPTHIYVDESLRLMKTVPALRGLAHITSDGFLNLLRMDERVGFDLDALPEPPAVFRALAARGRVSAAEMYTVFNMGIGMCAVVGAEDADMALQIARSGGKDAQRIGTVAADRPGVVHVRGDPLDGRDLIGDATTKTFRTA